MRIIAGSRKGHTIHAPRGLDTRPTSDRVRENVFNIVGPLDGAAARAIEQNLDKLRLSGTVLRRDGVTALAQEAGSGRKYDLVLVDPPYGMYTDLQPQLARYLPAVLAEDGLLVVETDARVVPELPLPQRTSRKYGQARVTVFEAAE